MKEKAKRLAPTKETLKQLFAKSGNQCSFNDCFHPLYDEEGEFIAQVCHIEAAEERGERFNVNSDNNYRRSYDNLILLCYQHHVKTNNVQKYSTPILKNMKSQHEAKFKNNFELTSIQLEKVYQQQIALLKEIKNDTTEILKSTDDIKDIVSSIKLQLNSSENDNLKRIEIITSIGISDKPKHIISKLLELEKNKWNELTDLEKYKLKANLGLCHLRLYNDKKSSEYFEEALQYQPNSAAALSFAALGSWISNNVEKAENYSKEALKLDKSNINAWIVYLRILAKKHTYDKILDQVPNTLLENKEMVYNLAYIAKDKGLFDKAINQFQLAIDLSETKDQPEIKAVLATTLLESISDPFITYTKQIDNDLLVKIDYCISLFTESWSSLIDSELLRSRAWWITNRGVAHKMKGSLTESIDDFKLACEIDERDEYSWYQLTLTLFIADRLDEALSTINEKLPDLIEKNNIKWKLIVAQIYHKRENYLDTIRVLGDSISELKEYENDKIIFEVIQILALSNVKLNNVQKARELVSFLIDIKPDEIFSYLIASMIEYLLTNDSDSETYVMQAFDIVNKTTARIDLLQLANQLTKLGKYEEAISVYSRLLNTNTHSLVSENIIELYYKLKKYKEALSLCETLTQNNGPNPSIIEYQVSIYEAIDNLELARKASEEYLQVYPDDDIIKVRLAVIYTRLGLSEESVQTVKGIKNLHLLSIRSQFIIVDIHLHFGDPNEGLKLAYQIRMKNLDNGKAHSNYFNAFLKYEMKSDELSKPDKVLLDSAVILINDNNQHISYTIENNETQDVDQNVSLESELGKLLINKRIGDTVSINNNIGIRRDLKIINIQNKYVYAMQKTMELLDTKFIADQNFEYIGSGSSEDSESNFDELYKKIDEQGEKMAQIFLLFTNQKISSGSIAEWINSSNTKVWISIITDTSLPIYSANIAERSNIMNIEKADRSIVLDVTTLLTFNSFENGLELLEKFGEKFIVPQSLIDDLNLFIDGYKSSSKTGLSHISKSGKGYILAEHRPEDVINLIDNYSSLIEKVNKLCVVKPINIALDMSFEEREEKRQLMGKISYDCMLLAAEHKCLYSSEEQIMKSIASNEYSVLTCSSLSILNWLNEEGEISKEYYNNALIILLEFRYQNLPMNIELLVLAFEKSNYQNKFSFKEATTCFGSQNDVNMCCSLAVSFLHNIYTMGMMLETKRNVTFDILRILTENRNFETTIRLVILYIHKTFYLTPIHKKEILDLLSDFVKVRYNTN